MALRLFERTLASVNADLRRLYVADAEHGYRLDLIDLDEFVGGLRSALRKQRDDNKALRAKFGLPDGSETLTPIGEIPMVRGSEAVRAGLLPRRSSA
jgi:hypothetical protein